MTGLDPGEPTGGRAGDPPPFDMPLGYQEVRAEGAVYRDRADATFHPFVQDAAG